MFILHFHYFLEQCPGGGEPPPLELPLLPPAYMAQMMMNLQVMMRMMMMKKAMMAILHSPLDEWWWSFWYLFWWWLFYCSTIVLRLLTWATQGEIFSFFLWPLPFCDFVKFHESSDFPRSLYETADSEKKKALVLSFAELSVIEKKIISIRSEWVIV